MSRTTDEINNQRWVGFNDTLRILKSIFFTWYHAGPRSDSDTAVYLSALMAVAVAHMEEEAFSAFVHETMDHNHPWEQTHFECPICTNEKPNVSPMNIVETGPRKMPVKNVLGLKEDGETDMEYDITVDREAFLREES